MGLQRLSCSLYVSAAALGIAAEKQSTYITSASSYICIPRYTLTWQCCSSAAWLNSIRTNLGYPFLSPRLPVSVSVSVSLSLSLSLFLSVSLPYSHLHGTTTLPPPPFPPPPN
ncbi:hypothetical protein F4814DRAFT_303640 [Daldinia grandis]|nr:hypothetical protein F4814DRAFT_303640 [Daldinia grandis]